jgi:hypothetical protein
MFRSVAGATSHRCGRRRSNPGLKERREAKSTNMPLFDDIEPAVSGYDCKISTSIQRATDTLEKMIRGEPVKNKQQLVIPEFRKGVTI